MSSQQDQAPSGDAARSAGLESPAGQAGGQQQARPVPGGQAPRRPVPGRPVPGGVAGGPVSAGKVKADGTTVFRTTGPLILFWGWVAIGLFALGDLVIQGHNRGIVVPSFVVIAITGLVYACALRSRVEADSEGITVYNPVRDYRVPWGAIKGVYLGDSVEIQCLCRPPKGEKTVYCWSLYSSRKSRSRASLRADSRSRRSAAGIARMSAGYGGLSSSFGGMLSGNRGMSAGYARMPAEAKDALSKGEVETIAAELGRKSNEAQARGQADGSAVDGAGVDGAGVGGSAAGVFVTSSWAWKAVAGILIPAAALALAIVLL